MKNFLKVLLVGSMITGGVLFSNPVFSEVIGKTAAGATISKTVVKGTEIWTSTTFDAAGQGSTVFATGAQIAEVTGNSTTGGLWDSVVGGLGSLKDWTVDGVKGAASWGWDGVKGAGKWVWDGVKGGYNWVSDGAVGLTDSIKNAGSLGGTTVGALGDATVGNGITKTVSGNAFGNYGSGADTFKEINGKLVPDEVWTTSTFSDGSSVAVGKFSSGSTQYQFYSPDGEFSASMITYDGSYAYDGPNGVTGVIYEGGTFPESLEGKVPVTTLENGNSLYEVGGYNFEVENGKVINATQTSKIENAASAKPSEQLAAEQKGEAKGKTGEAKDKAKEAKSPIDTANVTNAIQYAILILQSVEGMNQEDATREVTVKGAEKLKASQGQSAASTIATGTTLDGSTISCAANSMAYVLQNNTVDLGLLDLSEFDLSVKREHDVARSNRDLLLQQYGVSAQVIAEASNSISSQFYERTSALTEAAGTTSGSLGAASVVNDSERYPYFEMVRQAALSAVQLGLKGASILPDIQIINVNAAERDSNDDS